MFEPFKRKHTSPSNRYLEAISFGPDHRRMATPSVTQAPIGYSISSQPPLPCPSSQFQIHKGTMCARECGIAYREYRSGCTVYLSRSFLTYFSTSLTAGTANCFQQHISLRTVLMNSKHIIISLSFLDPSIWISVVKYTIIIILLYSPHPLSNYVTSDESMMKFCHAGH